MKKTLFVECSDCDGTGLYSGMCEPREKAVPCCGCGGKGWNKETFVLRRKTKRTRRYTHVLIRSSQSKCIAELGDEVKEIPYQKWWEKGRREN